MSRRSEINQRIKAKLDELADDQEDRHRSRRRLADTGTSIAEVKDELRHARRRLRRRRDAIEALRPDLDALEAETPDEDTPEEVELRVRLDQLAGEYDEAVAQRDAFLDRLDRLQEKHANAKAALQEAIDESEDDRAALTRLRKRRRRIKEARERNDRPSDNFDWAEFDCNDGTPLPDESKPAVKHWCETIGEVVRAHFGSVHINSAFRHRAYNARIGGEDNSVHIYDFPGRDFKAVAVDFSCAKGTPAAWYAFTAGEADGRGLYNTFHHADTRNRIGWPDATWSG